MMIRQNKQVVREVIAVVARRGVLVKGEIAKPKRRRKSGELKQRLDHRPQ